MFGSGGCTQGLVRESDFTQGRFTEQVILSLKSFGDRVRLSGT